MKSKQARQQRDHEIGALLNFLAYCESRRDMCPDYDRAIICTEEYLARTYRATEGR
ncbi:hypothetical protein [Brachybacterium sp. HMSC06H03]|uniref:hypothetical protein n=1 Tax=Brachybacterium sp. HMSC06H03 TaxID=1581127 RepID=UPI00143B5B58|nr:hypothetical protein [Brachybacterium sp. HMSC06H03]